MPVDSAHTQNDCALRFEWGLSAIDAVVAGADIAVVVDVLSFTTTLTVAMDAGIEVVPSRWRDDRATHLAEQHDAVLAVGRSVATPGDVSLCPATVRAAAPPPRRLVLPSPNGSTIAHALAARVDACVGASLRNAAAIAQWVVDEHPHSVIAVIAAGERWPDSSLRPAVEDLWGAGAVLAPLVESGLFDPSPEAVVAATAWHAAASDIATELRRCGSGRELIAMGHPEDVDIAAEVGSSSCVPILRGDTFVEHRGR
ncbi:MAG: 2-phosphosulfolactate phosphatase [Rhodococcus sp.]|nr:2-phosphosulfolactate phosphatase [Rhodococcus sp. (in: high G+C Gram-positive bacteria)]